MVFNDRMIMTLAALEWAHDASHQAPSAYPVKNKNVLNYKNIID